jgi:hypothetical protein
MLVTIFLSSKIDVILKIIIRFGMNFYFYKSHQFKKDKKIVPILFLKKIKRQKAINTMAT